MALTIIHGNFLLLTLVTCFSPDLLLFVYYGSEALGPGPGVHF